MSGAPTAAHHEPSADAAATYAILALFPAILALISLYGIAADPAEVSRNLHSITRALPTDARQLVNSQLTNVASHDAGGLTVGLVLSTVAALWSASTST